MNSYYITIIRHLATLFMIFCQLAYLVSNIGAVPHNRIMAGMQDLVSSLIAPSKAVEGIKHG